MNYDPNDSYHEEWIARRVKKGADLLDEHYVRWEDEIDTTILSTETTDRCVLGQIGRSKELSSGHSDYHDMVPIIFADWTGDANESAQAHGFDIEGGDYWAEEYHALDIAWLGAIKERKEAHA